MIYTTDARDLGCAKFGVTPGGGGKAGCSDKVIMVYDQTLGLEAWPEKTVYDQELDSPRMADDTEFEPCL